MLPDYFNFHVPTRISYSAGLASRLGDELASLGRRKALLVTDRVIAGLGLADRVVDGLAGSRIKVVARFDDVPPNSERRVVEACADVGIEARANLVIALGGGSVIDTAKVANILMKMGGRVADHQGAQLLTKPLFPLVVIPTTAGTGSEVTRVAVIADTDLDIKMPFTEDMLQPDVAILDPEMTVSMPPHVTGATGMDALTHAIEAYTGTEWSPASDAMALHAIGLVGRWLRVAVAYPEDMEARGQMLVASTLAGIAFSHSMVGIVHAVAHALGGVYHLPHGLANAIVLPLGMEHNLSSCPERYADVAVALGQRRLPSDRLTAKAGIARVRMLSRQLAYLDGLRMNLEQAGIEDGLARLDEVVDTAMADGAILYNPARVEPDDVRAIVQRAYRQPAFGLPVSRRLLRSASRRGARKEIVGAFKDTDDLYDVLGGFLLSLKPHPEIGPSVARSGILVRFNYRNPEASITIDATGPEIEYDMGPSDRKADVEMSMEADFAHMFWLGKANLVSALTRRQVFAKGAVHKATRLLPILKPAFKLYPEYLREKGLTHLIVE